MSNSCFYGAIKTCLDVSYFSIIASDNTKLILTFKLQRAQIFYFSLSLETIAALTFMFIEQELPST